MAETKTFSVSRGTVVRVPADGTGSNQGCGNSKHLYVGRYGDWNYDSYIEFNLDWSGVKTIISAVLNLYTDEYTSFGTAGEPGLMPAPASGDDPRIIVRRLNDAFTEGSNTDGQFDSGDFTSAAGSTSGDVSKQMTPKGANVLHQINITAIVKAWAPSSVTGGGKKPNHGIGLFGYTQTDRNWSGWSEDHTGGGGSAERPSITLTYELGPTVPNAPTNMEPVGAVADIEEFEGDFSDVRATDTLQSALVQVFDAEHTFSTIGTSDTVSHTAHGLNNGDQIYFTRLVGGVGLTAFVRYYVVQKATNTFKVSTTLGGAAVNVTNDYTDGGWSKLQASFSKVASESERFNDRFIIPVQGNMTIVAGKAYRWRARVTDQESQTSAFSGLVSFNLTNSPPNPPVLTPVVGSSFASLNLVQFRGGTFSDPEGGDYLFAHQVQLSPFPQGSLGWDDETDGILWDSGKTYEPLGATSWLELYGGRALTAGTYHWRARQWDQNDGASNWAYSSLVLTADFSPDPGSYDAVQIDPKAPWRILIRNLKQADGVTPTVGRAPGQLVAVLEEAKNVGASIVFNSPGELHFTLLKDDQQISVIEPKQVHYAVEFYSGDGWQEKFAGVVWDVDATETDVVFKGIDYLALFDTVIDERYDPLKPNKSYKKNGSYYEQVTIRNVILDQLAFAKKQTDSWVGFIAIGTIPSMTSKVSVYSTMQPTLSFMAGLIDSHRQGTGKRTRMQVVKTTTGTYQFRIVDDPGTIRSDLALYYGELVQGYRIIIFGDGWANVQHVIGRNRDGVKVTYKTIKGKPFQPSTSLYGRIATVAVMDGVSDAIDLNRRGLQAAIQSAKLGKQVAIGLRTEHLAPLQGWDVCDVFPLRILDGAVDTDAYGSGYWAAFACAWEATDIGQQSLIITFMPREDASAPDPDLIPSQPISTQPEWQLGWTPPDPLKASSKFWLDQSTGKVWVREDDNATLVPVTGTA